MVLDGKMENRLFILFCAGFFLEWGDFCFRLIKGWHAIPLSLHADAAQLVILPALLIGQLIRIKSVKSMWDMTMMAFFLFVLVQVVSRVFWSHG